YAERFGPVLVQESRFGSSIDIEAFSVQVGEVQVESVDVVGLPVQAHVSGLGLAGKERLGVLGGQVGGVPLPLRQAAVGELVNVAGLAAEGAGDGVPLLHAAQGVERLLAASRAAAVLDRLRYFVVVVVAQLLAAFIGEPVFPAAHALGESVGLEAA